MKRRFRRNPVSKAAVGRAEAAAVKQYKRAMHALGKKPTKKGAAQARSAMREKIRGGLARKPSVGLKHKRQAGWYRSYVGVSGPIQRKPRKARKSTKVAAKTARKAKGIAMAKHRKSPKRVAAGKKAARTRKRHQTAKRAASPRRHRKHVVRHAAPRRRRRTRRVNWLARYTRALHSRRPKRRTARMLRSARITVLRARAGKFRKMRAWAKGYARKHRMSTNPKGTMKAVVAAVKQVLPVAVTFFGTKIGVDKVAEFLKNNATIGPKLVQYDKHVKPVLAVAMIGAAHIASVKVGALRKHRTGIMIGASMNAIFAALKAYVDPAGTIGKYLSVGDADGVYDQALAGGMGEYVLEEQNGVGDYVETSDYVEIGSDDDLGAYEEIGSACGAYEDLGAPRLPARAIPRVSGVAEVQQWADEPLESFYTGVFGGGFGN